MVQDPLLQWDEARTKQGTDEIYDDLIEAINQIRDEIEMQEEDYRVVWKTEEYDYGSTNYTPIGFGDHLDDVTLKIEGGRGGRYEIIPRPAREPWIKYHPPDDSNSSEWTEPLTLLAIYSKDLEYGTGPGGIIEYLKTELPSL